MEHLIVLLGGDPTVIDRYLRAMHHRNTARLVGFLFIVATVAGVVSLLLQQPVTDAPDVLVAASLNESRVATGALFELIMGIAVVAIAIVFHPVMRRFSERLALGYLAARTIEAVMFAIDIVALFVLLTLSRGLGSAGARAGSQLQTLGDLLQTGRDWTGNVPGTAAFALSALILNFVLYKARLVPRWLSVWGLGGAILYLAGGVMVMYGLEPMATTHVVLVVPTAVQEMALAVWLIVSGFHEPAFLLLPGTQHAPVGGRA